MIQRPAGLSSVSRRLSFVGVILVAAHAHAQSDWTLRTLEDSPAPRSSAAMAYDSLRQVVVLFGGLSAGGYIADTWEWDGFSWNQRTPTIAPTPRASMAFTFDAARGVCVLHGGRDASGHRHDTWTWDGQEWQLMPTPLSAPQPRLWHSMVYDTARERVVLFGGFSEPSTYRPDTWEWDGTQWTQVIPSNQPLARSHHAMAYDSRRERVVMMCGHRNGPRFRDRWEYDGVTWTMVEGTTPLGPRSDPALVFDPTRSALVAAMGWENGFRDDAWEWSSRFGWSPLPTASRPSARANSAVCFDVARGQLVMFGGLDANGPLGDTWTYTPTGCAGESRAEVVGAASQTSSFALRCADHRADCSGPSLLLFGACATLPLALPPTLGCGHCTIALAPTPAWGSAAGELTVAQGLPLGFAFCVQCACVSIATNDGACVQLAAGTRVVVEP